MSIIKMDSVKPLPSEGSHNAVLAATYSLGLQPGYDGDKPKFKHAYVFELADKVPSGDLAGQPHAVNMIITDSLHEKSRLSSVIKALRGSGLTAQETQAGFDPESLVGSGCTVITGCRERAGGTVASIESILKRDPALPKLVPARDWSKAPEWVKRLQDQRLDKPKATDNAA